MFQAAVTGTVRAQATTASVTPPPTAAPGNGSAAYQADWRFPSPQPGPLRTAIELNSLGGARMLLDRGADPWAVDHGGANLGSSVVAQMATNAPQEDAARQRLRARLARIGWPGAGAGLRRGPHAGGRRTLASPPPLG